MTSNRLAAGRRIVAVALGVALIGLGIMGFRAVQATGNPSIVGNSGVTGNDGAAGNDSAAGNDGGLGAVKAANQDQPLLQVPLVQPAVLTVHVCGAVKSPGVYKLSDGSRVTDALNAAGGAGASAFLEAVNLASRVQDGQQIYIPHRPEPARAPETPSTPKTAQYLPRPVVRRTVASGNSGPAAASGRRPAAAGNDAPDTAAGDVAPAGGGGPAIVASREAVTLQGVAPQGTVASDLIDLNACGADDLVRAKGIGPVLAQRIIEYRASHGAFSQVDDLLAVSGIGPRKLESLKPFVTVH